MSNFILATAAQNEPSRLIMLPFAVLLLAIALLPIVLKRHWERYYHLVALFLAAITTGYYLFGIRQPERILHEAGDYIHFMALVGSLFVVAGGIHVQLRGRATPRSEERRVGKGCRSLCDWSSDVCSSDLS